MLGRCAVHVCGSRHGAGNVTVATVASEPLRQSVGAWRGAQKVRRRGSRCFRILSLKGHETDDQSFVVTCQSHSRGRVQTAHSAERKWIGQFI